ncbi:hypothetical protein KKH05_01930 [Patescibacteria group bacterium]|nr:hypothetical protein [Patescibacteria group bacterium]
MDRSLEWLEDLAVYYAESGDEKAAAILRAIQSPSSIVELTTGIARNAHLRNVEGRHRRGIAGVDTVLNHEDWFFPAEPRQTSKECSSCSSAVMPQWAQFVTFPDELRESGYNGRRTVVIGDLALRTGWCRCDDLIIGTSGGNGQGMDYFSFSGEEMLMNPHPQLRRLADAFRVMALAKANRGIR